MRKWDEKYKIKFKVGAKRWPGTASGDMCTLCIYTIPNCDSMHSIDDFHFKAKRNIKKKKKEERNANDARLCANNK